MADRLDRIEALLERTAQRLDQTSERLDQTSERPDQTSERLDRTAAQQEQNTKEIDTLLGAISTTEVEMRAMSQAIADNEQRFNILIQEIRVDRRASQQAFQMLLLQLANVNGRIDDLEQSG